VRWVDGRPYAAHCIFDEFVGRSETKGCCYRTGPGRRELCGGAAWLLASGLIWDGRSYSFANTPLKAAQPPLAIASMSHAGCVFRKDMTKHVVKLLGVRSDGWGKLDDLQVLGARAKLDDDAGTDEVTP
jgi:hypothetical protein